MLDVPSSIPAADEENRRCPNMLSLVSFAGMTLLNKCVVLRIETWTHLTGGILCRENVHPTVVSPYLNHSAVYISFLSLWDQRTYSEKSKFNYWSRHILDSVLSIWNPFWYISVFESTAYLKFTNLQHVFLWLSLQSHCRVTDEAFLAETSKYGPSTFLRMCSLLLKECTSCILICLRCSWCCAVWRP